MVHFSFALNEGYKFYFFPQILVLLFSDWRVMGLISCTHQPVWAAKSALQLRYTWFPAMSDLLRFEVWQVFLLENLSDVCLRMLRPFKIGVVLNDCSWGQMVTVAWTLLWFILALRCTKHIDSIFFSQHHNSSIFASMSNGVPYFTLINRFGQLKMPCSWHIRDSLLWTIC